MSERILHSLYEINLQGKGVPFECDVKSNDYNILHDHDYFEFILILNGSYINYINGEDYIGAINDAYLLRPGDTHKIINYGENNKHLNIMIERDYFINSCNNFSKNLLNKISSQNHIALKLTQSESNKIINIIQNINSHVFDNNVYYQLVISDLIYDILNQLGLLEQHFPAWLKEIEQLLENRESLKLSIEEFVKKTHYSHTHLSRLFKQKMGVSMVKYLQETKLEYASRYLVYTKNSVAEIASMLGYKEVSHFNHIFKAKFKRTPLQYRKLYSKEITSI